MSRVLICYFSESGEVMYDAICDVLIENNNDVFRYNINNETVKMGSWGEECILVNEELLSAIERFDPDLVLNFNNAMPTGVEEVLRKDCKVCLLDADIPESFWNKKRLKKQYDRYCYLGLQSCSKEMYEEFFGKPIVPDKNYLYFPAGTNIVSEPLVQDKNISFIGTNFHLTESPTVPDFYSKDAMEIYDQFCENYDSDIEDLKKKYGKLDNPESIIGLVKKSLVGQERLKYLQVLTDLGLTIYGVRWDNVAYYDFELAKCFDKTPIKTIKDNQWVYNTSKISVNISHPQAKSSFSWRVMDIMASQSCLLMEDKKDFRDLFGKYLSDEVMDAVIYKDRYDMRTKAIALLENESLRKKCVSELNNAIEENGRWNHRLKELQQFTGVQLIDNKDAPNYIILSTPKYLVVPNSSIAGTISDTVKANPTPTPAPSVNNQKSSLRKSGKIIVNYLNKVLTKIENGQ